MRATLAGLAAVAVVAALGGCGDEAQPQGQPTTTQKAAPAAQEFAATLSEQVTGEAMMAHLTELQEIADAHDGNRALGTPGYDASVDYVANALRNSGFDVQTPSFEARIPFADEPKLTVDSEPVTAHPLLFTIGTGQGGVSGPLVPARVEETPGCTASDYDGLPVDGAVVLVDRGACPFGEKQAAAAERGAAALIVANNVDGDQMGATLGKNTEVEIPVVSVTKAEGEQLRADPGNTTLELNAGVRTEQSRNVIAQTATGSTSDVVMVGSHLDSVADGPGINDNGSGVAAVLETALSLGSSPDVTNAVRFAFWGAEEEGLIGSTKYVETLDENALKDIALYLNFDMLGSPNPGYFTYDGDQSAPRDDRQPTPRVPEGSAGIERVLVDYLDEAGKTAQDTNLYGRSDYTAFTEAGVPSGGVFSGAGAKKTPEQVELWGGEAEKPFDPNYHKPEDTLDNIDRAALEINGAAVGYSVGLYAQDQRGRNGIPIREDRTRHPATSS